MFLRSTNSLNSRLGVLFVFLAFFVGNFAALPAFADVKTGSVQTTTSIEASAGDIIRKDYEVKEYGSQPTIVWRSATIKPRAVILSLHGLIMHGGSFDSMARQLVSQGYVVAAGDMRGYGRWLKSNVPESKLAQEVSYDESFEDILTLVKRLRIDYPDLPFFCVGESLGADMSMRLASTEPTLVDGLILASPAIKHHSFFGPVVSKVPALLANPLKQIDLIPYIRKFASEDPRIVNAAIEDPLVRKRLSAADIVRSILVFKSSLGYARQIPSTMPVLILQGSKDRVVKTNAVVSLISCLKSTDQTIRWFNARGHLLLETDYIYPDTMQIVSGWLHEHVAEAEAMKLTPSMQEAKAATFIQHDQLSELASRSRL